MSRSGELISLGCDVVVQGTASTLDAVCNWPVDGRGPMAALGCGLGAGQARLVPGASAAPVALKTR